MIVDAHKEHQAKPCRRRCEAPQGPLARGPQRARGRPLARTFRLAAGCAAAASVGIVPAPEHASPLAAGPALGASPGAHAAAGERSAAPARRTAGRAAASSYPAGASRPLSGRRAGARASAARLSALLSGAHPAHASSSARSKKKKKKPHKPALRGNPARALRAFAAMQRFYYVPGSGLYAGEPFSYLWPFSQALAATVSMANVKSLAAPFRAEIHARLIGLRNYLDTNNSGAPEGTYTSTLPAFDGAAAPPTGPGGPKFYDDNDWIGIELVRIYKLTHSAGALGYAEGVMAFEMAGYSTDSTLACPGGIPFSNTVENTDRNTVSTAPAAELALQLYGITHRLEYLQFAEKAYEWVRLCLQQPSGLYSDHIRQRGVIDETLWSYNQGTMIGAGTLLYQATGNAAYLYQARQTAKAALEYFTPQRLALENPFFPSVYFRNVMYLDSVTHDPPGAALAQAYVNTAWLSQRNRNDVFVGGTPPTAQLLVQAAIAQIYALLATPASTYF
jgi:Glycosyl hydrolase family 76